MESGKVSFQTSLQKLTPVLICWIPKKKELSVSPRSDSSLQTTDWHWPWQRVTKEQSWRENVQDCWTWRLAEGQTSRNPHPPPPDCAGLSISEEHKEPCSFSSETTCKSKIAYLTNAPRKWGKNSHCALETRLSTIRASPVRARTVSFTRILWPRCACEGTSSRDNDGN